MRDVYSSLLSDNKFNVPEFKKRIKDLKTAKLGEEKVKVNKLGAENEREKEEKKERDILKKP